MNGMDGWMNDIKISLSNKRKIITTKQYIYKRSIFPNLTNFSNTIEFCWKEIKK